MFPQSDNGKRKVHCQPTCLNTVLVRKGGAIPALKIDCKQNHRQSQLSEQPSPLRTPRGKQFGVGFELILQVYGISRIASFTRDDENMVGTQFRQIEVRILSSCPGFYESHSTSSAREISHQ